jgi:hypothetical protein
MQKRAGEREEETSVEKVKVPRATGKTHEFAPFSTLCHTTSIAQAARQREKRVSRVRCPYVLYKDNFSFIAS